MSRGVPVRRVAGAAAMFTVCAMTTHAMLEQRPLDVVPGGELTCQVALRNSGELVEAYRLEVAGDAAPWATVQPDAINLYPGGQATATVTFAPPRSSGLRPGEVPFAVLVIPVERPREAVAPEGVVTILPFVETAAEITPQTSTGRRRAKHEVAVDNRGNVPIVATLDGVDPDGKLAVRAHPATMTVNPGEAAFSTIAVANRRALWRGGPLTHPFQVLVSTDEQPPAVLNAATVQTPIVPKSLPRALAALLILALLLLGGWFLVVKPAAESAAREAVDKPLAEVAKEADSANEKADTADKKADDAQKAVAAGPGGGGAGAGAGGGGAPGASPGAPGAVTTAPARIRLQSTANAGVTPGTATHTVPERTTLVVTDLILQNPQGDTGRVDILAEGTPILTLALANFRDIDYHWVSPIEVPAGKTLTMRVTCETAGPSLAGSTGGAQCRIWMLANGVNRVVPAAP